MLKYTLLIVEVFEKLCGVILFSFRWQTDTVFSFDFLGPGLNSISPLRRERTKYTRRLPKNESTFKIIKTKKQDFK